MADFPSFGSANRAAPPTQKENFPNIRFACNVIESPAAVKFVTLGLSISNLKTDLVNSILERIFAYALLSASEDLILYKITEESDVPIPNVEFEIDITKTETQSYVGGTTPGSVGTTVYTYKKTASIDVVVQNLQLSLLSATLQRIRAYMSASVTNDLNP